MNPKEILRADLLDIVFDNRNKSYGAYALRKQYDGRLLTATGIGLAAVFCISLVVHLNEPALIDNPQRGEDVIPTIIEFPKIDEPKVAEAKPPQPAKRPSANLAYTSTIQIVKEDITNNAIPNIDDLQGKLIGVSTSDGDDPKGKTEPARAADPVTGTDANEKPETELLQRQPEFPGGKEAWMKFLSRYLTVPEELAAGEQKTVKVKFLVSEDGTITQFAVIQSGGKAFDNEVIRVLKKMPKWSPAVQNGRNVAVTFTQPVTFQSIEE